MEAWPPPGWGRSEKRDHDPAVCRPGEIRGGFLFPGRGAKTIALPPHGLNVVHPGAELLQLLPDPSHTDLNVVQTLIHRGFPYAVVKLLIGEDLAGILRQKRQKVEFQGGKSGGTFPIAHLPQTKIDFQ